MAPSENAAMKKKKLKCIEKNEDNIESKEGKKKGMKLSRLRKKRLIVRNLSFKVKNEELKEIFSKFGEVVDVQVPEKPDGKKRGFAFVQFKDTKSMIKAMKKLNFQKIHGRPIAIDFAVNKNTYLSRLNSSNSEPERNNIKQEIKLEEETEDSDDESILDIQQNVSKEEIKSEVETEDSDHESIKSSSKSQKSCDNIGAEMEDDAKVKAFLKEFDVDDEELQENSETESSAESSEDDGDHDYSNVQDNNDDSYSTESKPYKKRQSEDITEGKTVFIRNISFKNTEEELQEVVEEFGETVYCLFCNDPITGHFRGTAFVKFKDKESAEKLIEESSKEPGIVLDGRKLVCSNAVSREELSKRNNPEKNRDKRNLRLLKCGLIAYGSKEAEGVSQADMAKRAQLENMKKQKLRNVNFFISDKRLACHNIPKNLSDKELYQLFKKAGGKGAVVTKARIMKDFTKTDAQGNAVSRGFAFITFTEHEHALKALNELNNNPNIFTASKRPIVEFSVENKVALLSQERRQEKIKMQNRKRMEHCNNQNSQAANNQQSSETIKLKRQNNKKKIKQNDVNSQSPKRKEFQKKSKQSSSFDEAVSPKKKKKQKKGRKQKQHAHQSSEKISALTQMYKQKLLNKLS